MRIQTTPFLSLGLILLLFLLFTGFSLPADAPPTLSWSTAPFTDEASKLNNTRNILLFGTKDLSPIREYCSDCPTLVPLEVDTVFLNGLIQSPYLLLFGLFGISHATARLVSVFSGFLILVFLYLLVEKEWGRNPGLLAVSILGFNFFFLMYSRLALLEIPMMLFSLLFLFLWDRGYRSRKPAFYGLAILSLLIGFAIKPLIAFFFPVVFVAFAYSHLLPRFSWKNAALFSLLLGTVFTAFFLILSPDFLGQVLNYAAYRAPSSPLQIVQNMTIFTINWLFRHSLPLLILGFLGAALAGFSFARSARSIPPLLVLSLVWLFGSGLLLSLSSYQPPRYVLPLLLPLSILATYFLSSLYQKGISIPSFFPSTHLLKGVSGFFGLLFLFAFSVYLNKFMLNWPSLEMQGLATFGLFLLSSTGLLIVVYRLRKQLSARSFTLPGPSARTVVALLFLVLMGSSLLPYAQWAAHPQYNVLTASRHLESTYPEAVVLGTWSDALCFDTSLKCFPGADGTNFESVFHDLKITHLLNMRGETQDAILAKYRAYTSFSLEQVHSYSIGHFEVDLYALHYLEERK